MLEDRKTARMRSCGAGTKTDAAMINRQRHISGIAKDDFTRIIGSVGKFASCQCFSLALGCTW
jgi:hypothetical protein